jgi:hypothetical protein
VLVQCAAARFLVAYRPFRPIYHLVCHSPLAALQGLRASAVSPLVKMFHLDLPEWAMTMPERTPAVNL